MLYINNELDTGISEENSAAIVIATLQVQGGNLIFDDKYEWLNASSKNMILLQVRELLNKYSDVENVIFIYNSIKIVLETKKFLNYINSWFEDSEDDINGKVQQILNLVSKQNTEIKTNMILTAISALYSRS